MDREIVIRAQAGDREAFTRLAGTLTPSFLATAHRILRDISLAEDATQRAMINIWKGLPKLREPERFEAWSHRLLVRACYSEGRRTRRWEPAMGLFDPDDARTPDTTGAVVDRDELEVPLDEARLPTRLCARSGWSRTSRPTCTCSSTTSTSMGMVPGPGS